MSQTTVTQPAAASPPENLPVTRQPDGPGLRAGVVSEFTMIAPVLPGGAAKFRANLAKFQSQAGYYEGLLGTVHDLRIVFFDNDTRMLFAATYDGDFLPYVADVVLKAAPWLDGMFMDVMDGYPGAHAPGFLDFVKKYQIQADIWYVSNASAAVKDITKGQKVLQAFEALLDTAAS
jgi:hypothetical protein